MTHAILLYRMRDKPFFSNCASAPPSGTSAAGLQQRTFKFSVQAFCIRRRLSLAFSSLLSSKHNSWWGDVAAPVDSTLAVFGTVFCTKTPDREPSKAFMMS
jgi:hypothetical protein